MRDTTRFSFFASEFSRSATEFATTLQGTVATEAVEKTNGYTILKYEMAGRRVCEVILCDMFARWPINVKQV